VLICSGCKKTNSLNNTQAQVSTVIVSPVVLDFGKARHSDSPLFFTFHVENHDHQKITISEIIATCDCTVADISEKSIVPGGTGIIHVKVDISERSGNFFNIIRLIIKDQPEKIIDIRGTVITDIWFNEPSIRVMIEKGEKTTSTIFSLHTVDYPDVEFDWTGLENGLTITELSRQTYEGETVIQFLLTADIEEKDKVSYNLKIVPKIATANPFLVPVYCYRK
jgi:LEA14-like dessication related protein